MSDSRKINKKPLELQIPPIKPPPGSPPAARGQSKKDPSVDSRMTVKDVVMQIFNNFTSTGNTSSTPPPGRGGPNTVPGGDE